MSSLSKLKTRKFLFLLTLCIIYQPPVEWVRIFLSLALCTLGGFPYIVRAPACCAVTKMLSKCSYIEARAEAFSNLSLDFGNSYVKAISRDAISALNSNISLRWSISTWRLVGPDNSSPQVCLWGENGPLFLSCPLADPWTLAALTTANAWRTHSGRQGAVTRVSWKDTSLETFPLVLLCLIISLSFFLYRWHSSSVHKRAWQVLQARSTDWGRGLSNDDALTQVCVMWFAELLLPTKAQLEQRLVQPAQGVSILQGGEGIAGVAVCDEAKIVPGGNIAESQSLNEI